MRRLALLLAALLVGPLALSADASADSAEEEVHTALVEFDACLPLADGRVLAGSAGGMVVVDKSGAQQALYTALDGLPGTKIHALVADRGKVWVGTDRGAALVSIEADSIRVHRSFESKAVRDLWVDGDAVYVATWGQGLQRVTGAKLRAVHPATPSREKRVTSVAAFDGRLWWTTAGAGLWSKPLRGGAGVERSRVVPANAVLWSLDLAAGSLWIGGEEGLTNVGGKQPAAELRSVRATSSVDGSLFAASFGSGLQSLAIGGETPKSDRFARSLQSAHGQSCLGTQESLWIRRSKAWRQARLERSLPANDIAAFVSDGTQTYAGTFDQGVAALVDGHFAPLGVELDPHVNALAIDKRSGALWIGTSSYLALYKGKRLTRFARASGLPSKHVMSLFALPGGGVLVGTALGAAVVREGEVEPVGGKGGLQTGNVWAVAQAADGTQWLGTTRGVFRVLGDKVTRYRVASGELRDDWVMALALTDDGIFIGTYKAGVVRLTMEGEEARAEQLGEGWINPGGLHWDGTTLRAATMHGAFASDGVEKGWHSRNRILGRDTTAFVPDRSGGEWIVSRRGLLNAARGTADSTTIPAKDQI